MRRALTALLGLAWAGGLGVARAQARELAPTPSPRAPAVDLAPGAARAPAVDLAPRAAPAVDLAPAPPAPRTLSTWAEVRAVVRASATDLRVARADARAADARVRVELGALLPKVSAQGEVQRNLVTHRGVQIVGAAPDGSPLYDVYVAPTEQVLDGRVTLDQSIVSLEAWSRLAGAHATADAARLGEVDVRRSTAVLVASALAAVASAQRAAGVGRDGYRAAIERMDFVRRRRALGGGTDLDVERAGGDLDVARLAVIAADDTLRTAREQLGAAVGVRDEVAVDERLVVGAQAGDLGCRVLPNVEARPDVAAAEARVTAADLAVAAVRDQAYPTLSARLVAAWTNEDRGPLPRGSVAVSGIVSLPIFDGGARYGQLDAARAERERAEELRLRATREATQQAAHATRAWHLAEEKRAVLAAGRGHALEVDRLSRATFVAGHATSLDVVLSAAALRQAEIALAVQEVEVERARLVAALTRAVCDG